MSEFHQIIETIREFRPSILSDPLGTLSILADALQEQSDLGEEAAHALRYWRDIRTGLREPDPKWETWFVTAMEKYGPPEVVSRGEQGAYLTLRGRLLTMFTEAECFRIVTVAPLASHPIFTVAIREVQWDALYKLNHAVFSNTQDLTLDFRESTHIFFTGVVRAVELIEMPNLRNLGIHAIANRHTASLRGRASVAMMEAVAKKRIPKGTRLWWNGEPA